VISVTNPVRFAFWNSTVRWICCQNTPPFYLPCDWPRCGFSGLVGEIIEFNGIAPDEVVEAVPEEVQQGLNSVIIRAEKYLLEMRPAGR